MAGARTGARFNHWTKKSVFDWTPGDSIVPPSGKPRYYLFSYHKLGRNHKHIFLSAELFVVVNNFILVNYEL